MSDKEKFDGYYIFGNCKSMKELKNDTVDLILSGVPTIYNKEMHKKYVNIFTECRRVLKPNAPLVLIVCNLRKDNVFVDKRKIIGGILDNLNFKMRDLRVNRTFPHPPFTYINIFSFIVYSQDKIATKNKMEKNFYNYYWEKPLGKNHEEPINYYVPWIQHYTNEGDLVLDPFGGGGRVLLSALRLKRKCVTYEINMAWLEHLGFKHFKNVKIMRRKDTINVEDGVQNMIDSVLYDSDGK